MDPGPAPGFLHAMSAPGRKRTLGTPALPGSCRNGRAGRSLCPSGPRHPRTKRTRAAGSVEVRRPPLTRLRGVRWPPRRGGRGMGIEGLGVVASGRIELPTRGFSVAGTVDPGAGKSKTRKSFSGRAGPDRAGPNPYRTESHLACRPGANLQRVQRVTDAATEL